MAIVITKMADTATGRVVLPKIETSNVHIVAINPNDQPALLSTAAAEHYRSMHTDKIDLKTHATSKGSVQLDTWPVHSLRPVASNLSLGSTASYNQTQTDSNQVARVNQSKESVVPKPKFLEHLEGYLAKELRLLGCPPHGPSELRLQAHREAFEYLINEFKTYKPIMSIIKNEYELYIEQLQATLLRMKPLESQLVTVKEECDRKVMALREEEKTELKAAKQEIRDLHSTVDHMREKVKTLEAQIARLQEELGSQYEQYRNEADARKLLISDMNDLRARQQEGKTAASTTGDEMEDPVVLKLKLARAREDLKASNRRINTMLADYGDVVPRRDYERLEGSFQTLENEHEQLKNDHITLLEEQSALQGIYRQVCDEKAAMEKDVLSLRRTATPRPDWSRCAGYVEGGSEKWKTVSEGQSSDYLVDVLLAEIAKLDISEIRKDDNFQAMGTSMNIPAHLRGEGMVRNLHMSKKEVNQLISNFWKYHLAHDTSDMMMDDIMAAFLLESNQQDKMAALETAYSLHDSCVQMSHETHINLFQEIILGKLDEVVYRRWIQDQTVLIEALTKAAQGKEEISGEQFKSVLTQVFPTKGPEAISVLVISAKESSQSPGSGISFVAAMTPDAVCRPSEFVVKLLEQSREECRTFVQYIVKLLGNRSTVSVDELRSAILAVYPQISKDEVARVLSLTYGIDPSQLSDAPPDVTIPADEVPRKLIQLDIQQI